ncbi:MAG: GNAT family N-acetyltransferase [Paracoccaceae bacterium]|nr:MAG: GNAT family N-acetyltransferase [Paracoccaceae bacterium]
MMAPTLTTARLVLRPMRPGDFPAYAAFMATARAGFMGGPFDTRAAWGIFCHDAAGWALFGHGALMIEAGGETVGQVGISHGPLFPEPEIGWLLYDGHEGRGYATEAAAALRDWAFAQGLPTLVSYMDPQNRASAAVAERLGARLDPAATPQDAGDLVYRHGGASA